MIFKALFLLHSATIFTSASNTEAREIHWRILNGTNASPGQFPHHAFLWMLTSNGYTAYCGGSLISPRSVLTAAHCCADVVSMTVYLGMTITYEANNEYVQKFNLSTSNMNIHEQFDPNTFINDICVVTLPTAAIINVNVSTISLPPTSDQNPGQYDYKTATVSGFGKTNEREQIHTILQWTKVTLRPTSFCNSWYANNFKIEASQLCSGKVPLTGPCQGDSGGALTVPDDTTGKPVAIGVVSWGIGCENYNPVIYTYTPYFRDWIKQKIIN